MRLRWVPAVNCVLTVKGQLPSAAKNFSRESPSLDDAATEAMSRRARQ
jgi:hypothetical protein